MCTNGKTGKPAADTIPKRHHTYTEKPIVENLTGTGRRTRGQGKQSTAKRGYTRNKQDLKLKENDVRHSGILNMGKVKTDKL